MLNSVAAILALCCTPSFAQIDHATGLTNGSFEVATDGVPDGWIFPASQRERGYVISLDDEFAAEGESSAHLDATDVEAGGFGLLNQVPDIEAYRGERVRFRAAVRTAHRNADGEARLWLRVDVKEESKPVRTTAFDNMGDRPIRSDEWQYHEIVADVHEDATYFVVGMLAMGSLEVWIDDATLEIVDPDTEPTASGLGSGVSPPQPFFTPWLALAALVMAALVTGQIRGEHVTKFCLCFATAYWVLYSLPSPFRTLEPLKQFPEALSAYERGTRAMVRWTAEEVLGIDRELPLPGGSGDTTFSYVRLLVNVAVALLVAIPAAVLLRHRAYPLWLRDLERSYLRYVLGLTLLGYGLAKAGFIRTQFGPIQEWQLARTVGDASPMGLVWTFMAASPAYTFFSGAAEVLGGVLLLFRRTTLLGAFVSIGVMLNVVMLNFCYDVPVKQYSFHLMFMAVLLVVPERKRLWALFLTHKVALPSPLKPPYAGRFTIWLQRGIKAYLVIALFVIPIYEHTKRELTHEHEAVAPSEHLLMNRGFRWINEVPFHR